MKIVNLQISFYVTAHTYLHMYKHTHGNTQTHTHTGRGINFGTVELECLSQPRRGNFQHASIEFPSCADETMSPLCIISADISSSTLYSTHHIKWLAHKLSFLLHIRSPECPKHSGYS